jgi:hypothetical protein
VTLAARPQLHNRADASGLGDAQRPMLFACIDEMRLLAARRTLTCPLLHLREFLHNRVCHDVPDLLSLLYTPFDAESAGEVPIFYSFLRNAYAPKIKRKPMMSRNTP